MMKVTKKTTMEIHKENILIQDNKTNHLSAHAVKLLDCLYYNIQRMINHQKKKNENIDNIENILLKHFDKKPLFLNVKQTDIKEWIGLEKEKNYTKSIRDAITELTINIELKNYIDEEGNAIRWALKSFIKTVSEGKSKIDNKTIIYKMEIDKTLLNLIILLKKGYTPINLEYQKSWKGVNTIRLYQYIKSIQNMKIKPTHDIKWFNEYFAPKTKLKYLSKCVEILNRNIKTINNDADVVIILVVDKASKTFTFDIKSKNVVMGDIGKLAKPF